jgi:hypothetical protein
MPKYLHHAEGEFVDIESYESVVEDRNEAKARNREAAQLLIEALGAAGPETVLDTAKRAVAEIARLRGGKCKDCKFWTPLRHHEGENTCVSPKLQRGYGVRAADLRDGAWVEDDEGWAIVTGPLFGCINFESK